MDEGEQAAPWRAQAIVGFTRSALFDRLFQDGMDLVEETAAYLDGAGRHDARALMGPAGLAYGAASMRLTSRLTALASWLLVQRAVRQGDLSPAAAEESRYRLSPELELGLSGAEDEVELPEPLAQLIARSRRLHGRAINLDRRMYREAVAEAHPVGAQIERLRAAFGG